MEACQNGGMPKWDNRMTFSVGMPHEQLHVHTILNIWVGIKTFSFLTKWYKCKQQIRFTDKGPHKCCYQSPSIDCTCETEVKSTTTSRTPIQCLLQSKLLWSPKPKYSWLNSIDIVDKFQSTKTWLSLILKFFHVKNNTYHAKYFIAIWLKRQAWLILDRGKESQKASELH